jgi:hypothetical protein
MTTRFQDAASIIGPELAKTLVEDDDDRRRRKALHDDEMIVKGRHRGHTPQPVGLPLPTVADTLDAMRRAAIHRSMNRYS